MLLTGLTPRFGGVDQADVDCREASRIFADKSFRWLLYSIRKTAPLRLKDDYSLHAFSNQLNLPGTLGTRAPHEPPRRPPIFRPPITCFVDSLSLSVIATPVDEDRI